MAKTGDTKRVMDECAEVHQTPVLQAFRRDNGVAKKGPAWADSFGDDDVASPGATEHDAN